MDPPESDDENEVFYSTAPGVLPVTVPGVLSYVPPPITSSVRPFTVEVNSSTYIAQKEIDLADENVTDYDGPANEEPLLLEHNTAHYRGVVTIRKYQDVFFSVLYVASLLAMLISGIAVRASSRIPVDPIAGSLSYLVFDTLRGSLGIIAGVVIAETLVGALWLIAVRSYVQTCIWGTMIATPFLLIGFGIWTLSLAVPHTGTTIVGIFAIVGGVACFFALVTMWKRLNVTVSLFQLATSVLMDHFGLFWVALVTSLAYLVFSALWIYLFGSLFLLGSIILDQRGSATWTVDPGSYVALSFFLVVFLWTGSVLSNIQVYIVSGTTCMWYFHRTDLGKMRHNAVLDSSMRAMTSSFGSICFGALVLAIVQFLKLVLQRFLRKPDNADLDIFSRMIWYCANWIETIIMQVSDLSISHTALTGASFCASTRAVIDVLKRNMLDRVVIDWAAHVILFVWSSAISALCSFGVYLYAVNILHSPYSWVTALLSFTVAHAVIQFYVRLLLNVIDALFLCYALDCDGAVMSLDPNNENASIHATMATHFRPQSQTIAV